MSKEKEKKKKSFIFNWQCFKWLMIGMALGAIILGIFYFRINDMKNQKNVNNYNISIDTIIGTIKNMSDLITSELQYSGLVEYKNNDKKWSEIFTGKEFIMTYNAKVKAGIDCTSIKISKISDKVKVMIPHATLKEKNIDHKSIKFYNIKAPIINITDDKYLTAECIAKAEEDANNNINIKSLLDSAEKQGEKIIRSLIESLLKDKEIEIEFEYFK